MHEPEPLDVDMSEVIPGGNEKQDPNPNLPVKKPMKDNLPRDQPGLARYGNKWDTRIK